MKITRTDRALIATYVDKAEGEKFRIARNGELHIKGRMPNSIESGWYYGGQADDVLDRIREEAEFRDWAIQSGLGR